MAENEKDLVKKGGKYCVAGAPNNESCKNTSYTPGISMHVFPKDAVLRAKWLKFVRRHRVDFGEPISQFATLCSAHFEESCFENSLAFSMGYKRKRSLIKGSIPTRHTVQSEAPQVLTERRKRQLMRDALEEHNTKVKKRKIDVLHVSGVVEDSCSPSGTETVVHPTVGTMSSRPSGTEPLTSSNVSTFSILPNGTETTVHPSIGTMPSQPSGTETLTPSNVSTFSIRPSTLVYPTSDTMSSEPCAAETFTHQTVGTSQPETVMLPTVSTFIRQPEKTHRSSCVDCIKHQQDKNVLKRANRRLKKSIQNLKLEVKELKNKAVETASEEEYGQEEEELSKDYFVWSSNGSEEETEDEKDWKAAAPSDTDSSESNGEDDHLEEDVSDETTETDIRVNSSTPAYDEPKFIVFYSMLLQLFTLFCFKCKESGPSAAMKQNGTLVTVKQSCSKCLGVFIWKSQPPSLLGRFPIGNILLSFSVLMAGASIHKILLVFRHLGLHVYSARTFFRHQKSFLFPVVLRHWETHQASLVSKIRQLKDVAWTGDGRFDSVGHSAKYGVYTMLCTTIMKIVHFELVQANETGGSQQTELEGAKRSFAYLQSLGLSIAVFVSDRHRGIAKWIRENCSGTKHYFDIWHVARSITKKLLGLSKEKGGELIKDWMKGIRRHVYWCATSTKAGFEALIIAKWNSFMRHVCNKHENHPDPLYKECHHGDLEPRKWIKIGTAAYDKLKALLTKKMLVNDIKKLSPDAQTSCLEGFHATLNYWHPKMICFSWMGTLCRHILASLHFNENIRRDTQVSKDGKQYIRVTYPKFKLGEEVVREVACPPSYGYVDIMKKLLFTLPKSEMKEILERYSAKAPEPLNRQFPERKSKEEAVKSYRARQQKKTTLFPSEAEQSSLQPQPSSDSTTSKTSSSARRTYKCTVCKQPMRGHKGRCKK